MGGEDDLRPGRNGYVIDAIPHLEGHRQLNRQPQMATPPDGLPPMPVNLTKHPPNTTYYLAGFKFMDEDVTDTDEGEE